MQRPLPHVNSSDRQVSSAEKKPINFHKNKFVNANLSGSNFSTIELFAAPAITIFYNLFFFRFSKMKPISVVKLILYLCFLM